MDDFEKRVVGIFFIVLFLLAFFFIPRSLAWEKLDYVTYSGFTGKEVTIGWSDGCEGDDCTHPDEYEFKFYHKDMDADLITGNTPNTQVTIVLTRIGHYIPKVRAIKNDCQHEDPDDQNSPLVPCYSDWAESINPIYATVDGESKAWWIFTWISPPGGGGISITK